MNRIIIAVVFTALTLAVICGNAVSSNDNIAGDQVRASFDREFNHEVVPAAVVTRAAIDDDELYALVNNHLYSSNADDRGVE